MIAIIGAMILFFIAYRSGSNSKNWVFTLTLVGLGLIALFFGIANLTGGTLP